MPEGLNTPAEVGAVVVAVVAALGTITAATLGAAGVVYAAWRTKIKPLLAGTQAAATSAAEQLQTNHGSSLRDAVNRIEDATGQLGLDVRELRADQRTERDRADRARSELFRRVRALETPGEDTRP